MAVCKKVAAFMQEVLKDIGDAAQTQGGNVLVRLRKSVDETDPGVTVITVRVEKVLN